MTGKKISPELLKYAELDKKVVEVGRTIKILSSLGWPAQHGIEFLKNWHKGNPKLPKVTYPKFAMHEHRRALNAVLKQCDVSHPVGQYLYQTCKSYIAGAVMLESIGGPVFQEMSEVLYGTPKDRLGSGHLTNLDAANNFISVTSDFAASAETISEEASCLTPQFVAAELQREARTHIPHHQVEVVIDDNLSAKAAAGARRLRIRGMTSFAPSDIPQLLQHELLVHSVTMLNGREQPYLKSMGLGSPRTTCTQEGLATFAELITATMDLSRLRRIALRIKGINLVYDGGDFLDVFRFFLDSGQAPQESFQSAARIFRGGNVHGKVCFTKDIVYLKGLISVHTFLRKAAQMRKIKYPRYLVIGRIALGDILNLEPFIESGYISAPLYQPPWIANREGLVAYLSYAVFANQLNLGQINLSDFIENLPDDIPETNDASAV